MAGLISFCHVTAALELADFNAAEAQGRMAPAPRGWQKRESPPTSAAVMIVIFADGQERLKLVLTLRTAALRGHSGQVSFPGGRQDPQDPSLSYTALRETCEEIGICSADLQILGEMACIYIPTSHFDVLPTVARFDGVPDFVPNPAEVADVFSFGLDELLQPRFKRHEKRRIRGVEVQVPYYAVHGYKVWGATAIILSELEGRLHRVLPQDALSALAQAPG